MLRAFPKLGCPVSIKIHFLFYHLDRSLDNLSDTGDKQGEWFRLDTEVMQEQYQGRWDVSKMINYCWSVGTACSDVRHTRKSRKRKIVP